MIGIQIVQNRQGIKTNAVLFHGLDAMHRPFKGRLFLVAHSVNIV